MSNTVKIVYGDLKINIKSLNNKWWLDFYHNNKRIRKSTLLTANDKNLTHIKNIVIPEIVIALTGNKEIEYFKKDLTLDEFSVKFFEVYKGTVREHVYKSRSSFYDIKIKPYFGNQLLNSITPLELENWQNQLLKKHKVFTVVTYRSVFYSIFDKALVNDIIKYNPLSRVKSPLTINKKFKKLTTIEDDVINPFNKSEILKILESSTGNLYYAIFIILHTGIRPGELISLTWNDIDFNKKRIAVDKTTWRGKVGDVKTQASVRYIDILPQLEIKLKELKEISGTYNYLLLNHSKKPFYSHDVLNLRFRNLLKQIGIKERSIYNLRHTFASHMISNIEKGVDILWVSKMLGHKDVSITLKVYAKFIKEDDNTRINKLKEMGIILDII
ncbi:tyrosine-type recombinase/integrase [Aliarcobacter butzleri]|uniref:tyrosine-type recombinase/integrase n=1 Tax=Aliarcobacter butzleri TaxID=28197 RepID=UPI0021B32F41|nr:site-specific integrase [Aliarcobacter butzleri]MCT7618525.1 site-specific integrase [Aliarcobacter butzleri]